MNNKGYKDSDIIGIIQLLHSGALNLKLWGSTQHGTSKALRPTSKIQKPRPQNAKDLNLKPRALHPLPHKA